MNIGAARPVKWILSGLPTSRKLSSLAASRRRFSDPPTLRPLIYPANDSNTRRKLVKLRVPVVIRASIHPAPILPSAAATNGAAVPSASCLRSKPRTHKRQSGSHVM